MIEIFRRPQHHTKANIQYNFIIQKTFKVCILSCQRASVPFSTGPGGKEIRDKYEDTGRVISQQIINNSCIDEGACYSNCEHEH